MSSSVHRPCVNIDFAAKVAETFYNFERISEIKELSSYSDRNFYVRGRRNKLCTPHEIQEQGEYVLKILNSADSEHGDFVDAENEAMTFLRERNFPCPVLYPVDGGSEIKRLIRVPLCNDSPKERPSILEDENRNLTNTDEWCVIRLISFLPGVTAESFGNFSCENLFNIGEFVATLSKSLQEFQCTVLRQKLDRWSMENFLSLESYVTSVEGEENKDLVREVMDMFATQVAPKLSLLRRGTIHNDVTKENLLIDTSSDKFKISGLVDFGDMRQSCLLFELANTIAAFINEDDVLLVSGYLLAGYQAFFPLPGLELDLLYDVVCARLCQVFLITSSREKESLDNEYLRKLLTDYSGKFKAWLSNSREDVVAFWRKVKLD